MFGMSIDDLKESSCGAPGFKGFTEHCNRRLLSPNLAVGGALCDRFDLMLLSFFDIDFILEVAWVVGQRSELPDFSEEEICKALGQSTVGPDYIPEVAVWS